MKCLLTADWQAKHSNLDACKRAHNQELEIIAKHKVDLHIDLGDLKDDFNPVSISVVEFAQQRSQAIREAVKYDIKLLGNHDMLGQYAHEKNWFSVLRPFSKFAIDTPKVLHIEDCTFCCLPFRRDPKRILASASKLYEKVKSAKHKFLLGHFSVSGSRYSKATSKREENNITVSALNSDKYQRSFFGHIHLKQRIGERGMYVGNPFATDNGEIDQQKGFLLYDTSSDKLSFIPSEVPGIFSWPYILKHKPKLPDGTRIKAVVDTTTQADYHKDVEALALKIEKKYPFCISYVTPRFQIQESKQTVEINPNASDLEKVRSYVFATIPVELKQERKTIVQYLASKLVSSSSPALNKIVFEKVVAENVLSFEKVEYSFRNQGVVLVEGENKDWPGHSNGSGKSSLLGLIPIALSGRTFKGERNDEWASNRNSSKSIVTLSLSDSSNNSLKVIRQRRPMKLKFKVNSSDESTGRRHTGKKETQGLIEEATGYTFETLANSIYVDQALQNAFLTGTSVDRAKLIHAFQDLDRFRVSRDSITKELSSVKDKQIEISTKLESQEDALDQLSQDIESAKSKELTKLKLAKEEVKQTRQAYLSLKKSTKVLTKVILAKEQSLAKKIEPLEQKLPSLEREESKAELAVEQKEEQVAAMQHWNKDADCPACYRKLSSTEHSVLLKRFKKSLTAKKLDHKRAKQKVAETQKHLDQLKAPLLSLEDEKHNAKTSLSAVQNNFKIVKENLASLKSELQHKDSHDLKLRKLHLLHEIKRSKRIAASLVKDKALLLYSQDAMSRDGLPSFLNKLLCPQLNKAAEYYSKLFVDSELQVTFDIEKGQITPSVVNLHGGESIKSQSTGEKAWAGLITSFALREIAHPTNLLILDEPGHGLDPQSAKMFGEKLSQLKSRFETIMIVTHNQNLISSLKYDNAIIIVKKSNVSSIQE